MTLITIRPFRLQVLDALTALIETITPANGFQNDLSIDGRVIRGRLFIGDDEPVPMVAINEPPLAIEPNLASVQNPSSTGDWDLLIQGWTEDDPKYPCDATYVLAAEVRAVIARQKTRSSGRPGGGRGADLLGFGPVISDLRIGAPVVRPPDDTSAKACFYLLVTLKITEDMTKPFG
ncbi:MAG: hypothetical protein P4M09_21960 [Devosia sp.]|nr:hypothetical protein [Devosia sp.]